MIDNYFSKEDISIISKLFGREPESKELEFLSQIHGDLLLHRPYFETIRRLNKGAKRLTDGSIQVIPNNMNEFICGTLLNKNKDTLIPDIIGFDLAFESKLNSPQSINGFIGIRKLINKNKINSIGGKVGSIFHLKYKKEEFSYSKIANLVSLETVLFVSLISNNNDFSSLIYKIQSSFGGGLEISEINTNDEFISIIIVSKFGNDSIIKEHLDKTIECANIGLINDGNEIQVLNKNRQIVFSFNSNVLKFLEYLPERHTKIKNELVTKPVIMDAKKPVKGLDKASIELFKYTVKLENKNFLKEKSFKDDNYAFSTPYNLHWSKRDPRHGGRTAVASAIRELVVSGYTPISVSIHNFLSDSKNSDYWKGIELLQGQEETIRFLNVPLGSRKFSISKNNEHTQFIVANGKLGPNRKITADFKNEGDFISILGSHRGELGGSAYFETTGKDNPEDALPALDMGMDQRIQDVVQMANQVGLIQSAINIGRGGLCIAVMKTLSKSGPELGARIFFSRKLSNEEILFGETQGLVLVSLNEKDIMEFERICIKVGVPSTTIGRVTDDSNLVINDILKLKRKDF